MQATTSAFVKTVFLTTTASCSWNTFLFVSCKSCTLIIDFHALDIQIPPAKCCSHVLQIKKKTCEDAFNLHVRGYDFITLKNSKELFVLGLGVLRHSTKWLVLGRWLGCAYPRHPFIKGNCNHTDIPTRLTWICMFDAWMK